VRSQVSKMISDLGMEVPPAIKEGKPVGELLDAVNEAFMTQLDLPPGKIKEAVSMRSKIREAFAKQEASLVPVIKPINWEGYKAALEDPVLVDEFKAAMEKALADPALKEPPQPTGPDPLMETVAQAESMMKQLSKAVSEDLKESEAKLVKLKARAKAIKEEIDAIEKGNVTLDSELARYPDIAAKIDQEILDDKW